MNGCDKELTRGEFPLPDGGRTRRCPRAQARGNDVYFKAFSWYRRGSLDFIYDPDTMPSKVAEAIDVIEQHFPTTPFG